MCRHLVRLWRQAGRRARSGGHRLSMSKPQLQHCQRWGTHCRLWQSISGAIYPHPMKSMPISNHSLLSTLSAKKRQCQKLNHIRERALISWDQVSPFTCSFGPQDGVLRISFHEKFVLPSFCHSPASFLGFTQLPCLLLNADMMVGTTPQGSCTPLPSSRLQFLP